MWLQIIIKVLISCFISSIATFVVSYSGFYLVHNAELFFISLIFAPGMGTVLMNLNISEELILVISWLITTFYYYFLINSFQGKWCKNKSVS